MKREENCIKYGYRSILGHIYIYAKVVFWQTSCRRVVSTVHKVVFKAPYKNILSRRLRELIWCSHIYVFKTSLVDVFQTFALPLVDVFKT
jgi:hypothetical protein